ncbi:MAG: hypothetical protein JSV03_12215 [Planctomycetota bacterium]|nr:MAG: hypothetical protein JSV03_12215 [Planctomycetota bacterium]
MIAKNVFRTLWAAFLIAGIMGGCECQRDVLVDEGPEIERPTMAEINPHAERPYTHFPSDLHTQDVSLNKFIEKALTICEEGDYDSFRQLFGTAYTPTEQKAFERVWHNVRDIRVINLKSDKKKQKVYYLHAVVRLRKPDKKERQRGDLVIIIFKEAENWRLGPAPKEIVNQVLEIDEESENAEKRSILNTS